VLGGGCWVLGAGFQVNFEFWMLNFGL